MNSFIKVTVIVVSAGVAGWGAVQMFKLGKAAYDKEVSNLKKDIQDQIDNIVALTTRHGLKGASDQSALLEEARAQLLRTDPDVELLRTLLAILRSTVSHMIQDSNPSVEE